MKKMIMILMFLVGITGLNAQGVRTKNMDDLLPFDPSVTIGVLDNGLKYYIRENKLPADRAELRLVVKAAAIQEDDDQKGLAHFLEHMCFNGTKNFPKNELVNFLESTGVRFGADLNASTGFDRTYYILTIPLDKEGLLDGGFQVLEDWAHNVTFDQVELDKERGVIMEEWRLYRGAQERVMKNHYPYIFHNSKFADRLPIGDTAVILHAPRQRFLDFYNEWYRPDLMAVVAVGDFKKDDIEKIIKEKFGRIPMPKEYRPLVKYPIPAHKETLVSIATDKELPMPNLSIIYKHPGREGATYGNYRYGLMEQLINTMFNVRVSELSRKPNPPFLYAGGSVGGFIAGLNAFNLVSVSKTDELISGMEAIVTEAYRMKQHGFTKSELDRAKQVLMTMIEKAYSESDKTESADYAEEYYRNFYEDEGMPGIAVEREIYQEFVPKITLDEVNAYAKSLVSDENKVILLSAPEKDGIKIPTKAEILAAYNKVASTQTEAYLDESTDKPLMAKLPKAGKVVETKKTGKFDIVEMKLSNGAKVLVKQTDFKNDEVLFKAWSPGGSSLASDADLFSASMADGIVDEGGISEFSANTLEKMMSGKIARVSPSIGELTEGFDGSYQPKDAEAFFQMLHLYFTSPRKDAETFQALMSRQKEAVKNSKRNPESYLQDSMTAIMNGYNPRSMPWTEKSFDKVNLDKAMSFYQDRFADASDFTFIFVGSVNMDDLKKMLETYVASLPSTNRKETWKNPNIKYAQGPLTKEIQRGIEPKSTVRLVMSDKFDYTGENIMAVNSMIEVFSIRLREVIREDKGGVYGIGARPRLTQFPESRYSIYIMFGCNPTRVDELIDAAKDVITELQTTEVSAENLTKIKEVMKREFETSQKENRFWLSQIYNADYNKMDIARLEGYMKKIDGITAKDIQKTAQKYLQADKMMKFILNPED